MSNFKNLKILFTRIFMDSTNYINKNLKNRCFYDFIIIVLYSVSFCNKPESFLCKKHIMCLQSIILYEFVHIFCAHRQIT